MDKILQAAKDAVMYAVTNGPKVVGGVFLGTITYRYADSTYDDMALWNAERKYKQLKAKQSARAKALSEGKGRKHASPSAPRSHSKKGHESHAGA